MYDLRGDALCVRYGQREVFKDLNIALRAGRFVALVGPNGGGKSSLLRVLAGMQPPNGGQVHKSASVAYIAPSTNPPADITPLDLAGYGLGTQRRFWRWKFSTAEEQRIREAIARCDLAERAEDLLVNLSAGETQRAWIAAALASSADILLIDEPTTHLDVRFQIEVLQTLKSLSRAGVCVVAAMHDLTLAARFADEIALLAHGRLSFGRTEDIFKQTLLSEAFSVPLTMHRHPEEGYLICLPA